MLVGFLHAGRCTKAGRLSLALLGHLAARCLSRPTHGDVSTNFGVADCSAGRQGGAAGLHGIPAANNFSKPAYGKHPDRANVVI